MTGVDVIVVVESVEGAVDGVPNNAARADATQDFGKEVIDHPGVTAMTVTAMVVAVFIGVLPGVGEQFIGFQDQRRGGWCAASRRAPIWRLLNRSPSWWRPEPTSPRTRPH